MRRFVWLAVLTVLFVSAVAFTGFLREMAHNAIGSDPVQFIARANREYREMVAVETFIYVVACALVMWQLRKV